MKVHVEIPGTGRTYCGKAFTDRVYKPSVRPCETCMGLSHPDSKTGVMLAQAVQSGAKVKTLKLTPAVEDLGGLPAKPPRKELTQHDLDVVKRSVKQAMSGGYGQVYGWCGEGFKEHWADSITLLIVTGREGVHDADWVHQLRLAVYRELKLETVDVASPFRMADLSKPTGDKR